MTKQRDSDKFGIGTIQITIIVSSPYNEKKKIKKLTKKNLKIEKNKKKTYQCIFHYSGRDQKPSLEHLVCEGFCQNLLSNGDTLLHF